MNGKLTVTIVLLLAALALFVGYLYIHNELAYTFFPNLIAEVVGIAFTVFFVDWLLSKERKREKARYRKIALTKLGSSIREISSLFAEMIKASMTTPASVEDLPKTFKELFQSPQVAALGNFDFEGVPPIVPRRNWFKRTNEVLSKEIGRMNQTIDTYIPFLEPDTIELVNSLENDTGIAVTRQVSVLPTVHAEMGIANRKIVLYRGTGILENTFDRIVALIDEIERSTDLDFKIDESFWLPTTGPSYGSSRIEDEEIATM